MPRCIITPSYIVRFTLTAGYPRIVPKLEVMEGTGTRALGKTHQATLTTLLEEEAARSMGQVMCYEIATVAQGYLQEHNHKPQTFYEAMLSRERREEEALQQLRGREEAPVDAAMGSATGSVYADGTTLDAATGAPPANIAFRNNDSTASAQVETVSSSSGGLAWLEHNEGDDDSDAGDSSDDDNRNGTGTGRFSLGSSALPSTGSSHTSTEGVVDVIPAGGGQSR